MIPNPERGFKREANAKTAQLSTIQKVVRYAEKDDFLLYVTALFGIIMPALMYFFYKTIHTKYNAYSQKRKEAKRKEKLAKQMARSTTIFYSGTNSPTKRLAYDLAEELDAFDPIVSNLNGSDVIQKLKASKSVFIFLVETNTDGTMPDLLKKFLEWLDEIRYEHRQKQFFRNNSFAIFGTGSSEQNDSFNRSASTLNAKLKSLQGNPMLEPYFANNQDSKEISSKLKEFSTNLLKLLKQFQYGEFDINNLMGAGKNKDDDSEDYDGSTCGSDSVSD